MDFTTFNEIFKFINSMYEAVKDYWVQIIAYGGIAVIVLALIKIIKVW